MKKSIMFLTASFSFAFLLALASCSKTDTPLVAFTNTKIKTIFDAKCASCHASGKSNASAWLYNPADFNGSIKGHIGHLYEQVYTLKKMPTTGPLSTTELADFKTWYDAGYPAN